MEEKQKVSLYPTILEKTLAEVHAGFLEKEYGPVEVAFVCLKSGEVIKMAVHESEEAYGQRRAGKKKVEANGVRHTGDAVLKAAALAAGVDPESKPEPKRYFQLGIQGGEVYPQPLPNRPVIRFLEDGMACDTSKSFPRGELPLTLRVDEALQKIAEKEKNGCAGISFERLQESRADDRFRKFHFLPEDIAEHLRADNEGDVCWICQLMDQDQGLDHHLNERGPRVRHAEASEVEFSFEKTGLSFPLKLNKHPLATESAPVDASCFNEFRPKAKIDTSPRAIQWFKDKKKREREAIEKEARQVFDH